MYIPKRTGAQGSLCNPLIYIVPLVLSTNIMAAAQICPATPAAASTSPIQDAYGNFIICNDNQLRWLSGNRNIAGQTIILVAHI